MDGRHMLPRVAAQCDHETKEGAPMSRPKTLLISASMAALLMVAIVVPVAAAQTKLEVVNGIPGQKIDVCVNGREIKSGLPYGKYVAKSTKTTNATVRFYKRDARRCGGKLLAKKTSGLDDATFVISKRGPGRVRVFDNSFIASPTSALAPRSEWRHAADVGVVTFGRHNDLNDPSQLFPAADNMAKGQIARVTYTLAANPDGFTVTTEVSQLDVPVVKPQPHWISPLRRYEWILVGTNLSNAKLIFIERPAAAVAP